ncbi:cytochrome b/b6 domain-containing protein [Microbacterium oxydans]|uniref:cytochrome b/b6 domain-containing protein n=1 Tax=Microbacterium oxydans TaxID=82380 RepID=UPI0027D9ADC5|nr:cytochrome b/b6 domain-containing protein [Microbacterium oxydans]
MDDRAADAVTSAAPDEPATIPEVAVSSDVDVPVRATGPGGPASPATVTAAVAAAAPATAGGAARIRRGLPRVPGGEPWPPSTSPTAPTSPAEVPEPAAAVPAPSPGSAVSDPVPAASASVPAPAASTPTADISAAETSAPVAVATADGTGVRRGLPRVAGGDPWPPADTVPLSAVARAEPVAPEPVAPEPVAPESVVPAAVVAVAAAATPAVATGPSSVLADVSTPLPWTQTVWNGRAPRHLPQTSAPTTGRPRPTWTQAIGVLFGAAALGVLAGAAIAFVRTLLSFPFMQDFLAAFPGEYEPGIAVEPGFAPWIGWQHFFNMFLMVLIIRSGLQVRTEKRPTVFWTPRNNAKGKISLNLWFHQSLDILWLVNGVIFVVLLFVTGHWVRIVPTSWEVFPNALSAALQYISFDWPHENGWNNYNSLQQLAYFATVFIAAPLAAITGFRMSGLWPKKAEKLSKAYPVEWARALHFPIMLYFVAFIIAHVALVMLTGFLRNLNHMFASQDAVTWTGFWVFILSLVVIAIGWAAARPLVLAPIAKVFGKVSGR